MAKMKKAEIERAKRKLEADLLKAEEDAKRAEKKAKRKKAKEDNATATLNEEKPADETAEEIVTPTETPKGLLFLDLLGVCVPVKSVVVKWSGCVSSPGSCHSVGVNGYYKFTF